MPYKIRRKGKCYEVVNADTGKVHAKCTSRPRAEAQIRIMEGAAPDNRATLSNGTKVNVYYTGRGSGHGKAHR